jgi:signal transduction histidine kinase
MGAAGLLLAWVCNSLSAGENLPRTPPVLLTNAAQIRSLTAAQAAKALSVDLVGVVMDQAYPSQRSLVLADQTAGMYVLAPTNLFAAWRQGDLIEVEGVTDPGQFAPIVLARTARKLGTAPVPAPRMVTYQQLITGALDAQWVEIAGVVRRCIGPEPGADIMRLEIAADGGIIPARLLVQREPQIQADAEVRVRALCFYQFNQKRQVTAPVLQVPRGVPVLVEKPAPGDPYAAPVCSAASLLQFSPDSSTGHRIHLRGVVIYSQPDSFVWIRDESSGLRLQNLQKETLLPGDMIDVLGFPAYGYHSPVLGDAIFQKTGVAQPPTPLLLTNAAQAFDHEDDLVALRARLTEIQPILDGFTFTLDKDGTIFKAILKTFRKTPRDYPDWQPGSTVSVAGICFVVDDEAQPLMGIWHPQAFQILLRSPLDLRVIQPAPWGTSKHIIQLLGLVTAVSVIGTALVMFLARRRLHDQVQRRAMAEGEFAAILSERNRMAREIHDTLAQGLAATSVQLRLVKKHAQAASEPLLRHLDTAQQLVRGSLEDARNSIWNMRSQILETSDLAAALERILKQMTEDSELETSVEVTGRARRLAPVVENNLLRVGQEAITNATKHAGAKHIKVALAFGPKQLRLVVSDDGRGFDPAKPPATAGGFGLVSMRERAAELRGEFNVRSAPGQGVEINLSVPLSGE